MLSSFNCFSVDAVEGSIVVSQSFDASAKDLQLVLLSLSSDGCSLS